MIRLNVVVEGHTEENFVIASLREHLALSNVMVFCRKVQTGRSRGRVYKGGILSYQHLRQDLIRWFKEENRADTRFTTMLDVYGLPAEFPGYGHSSSVHDPYRRVEALERQFESDLGERRFIPYLRLHEFEALLLSDPGKFRLYFDSHERAIRKLEEISGGFDSPEQIDDGHKTAPSKRIIKEIPGYRGAKRTIAPQIAKAIGLKHLRQKCPHFDRWMTKLESLDTGGSG